MTQLAYTFPVSKQETGTPELPLLFEFGESVDNLVRHQSIVHGREVDTFHYDNPDSV